MAEWHIGVIGGSGLYQPGALDDAQEIPVGSAFGKPSGPVTTGRIAGVRFTFIARHGPGHALSPSYVNYRANIDALKRCGVTDILAISAIGSLAEEMEPGQFVAVDQLIDRTTGRERSFFGDGIVAHVPMADPICPRLSGYAIKAAKKTEATVHETGTYVAIEGPQFSTRAESLMYRSWGAHVIGMTAMPEARLAREAELPYALLGMVTDYDCWRDAVADVDVADILAVMQANADIARNTLQELASVLPKTRKASPIDTVLETAIVTPPEHWAAEATTRLDAVAGRLVKAVPQQGG
ncbi:S-methyl-5'-thioadenosine phosphorylase [Alteraurantiacibacter aquimixticola]|uniref:S-methyl-5'-thioadenosine phosphorylase n=1 Tax=Alteraurantiacibacter aquimixticola TaxID=2489173 RepID=A0A4V4U8U0_9SPHN|nr:S-methyl-5'-thioadenosine phosphorylase [Alteraurantiacibacter aquimixticola]TIX51317.1 S-methyl-5'-thioadenosine phosphorylase [Alteraurantiacibacter aquimixticola]